MKNYTINNYQSAWLFGHYFRPDPLKESYLFQYEHSLLDYIVHQLPDYVENILIFGCASGRDFLPFIEKYNCFGFDLEDFQNISWVCPTENLEYYQCSIEDFIDHQIGSIFNLSTCLIYTQGVMMYLSPEDQSRFINYIVGLGCRNIVFHEYPPEYKGMHPKLNPSGNELNLFTRRHFREKIDDQPTGFLYLNK